MRMLMAESASEPELADICKEVREAKEWTGKQWVKAAIERGELDPTIDADLLFGTLVGALHNKLFARNERVDELFITRLVDMLLLGASTRKKPRAANRNKE